MYITTQGALPEFIERLFPRLLVDVVLDFALNYYFGVPDTYEENDDDPSPST